jgi:integrase
MASSYSSSSQVQAAESARAFGTLYETSSLANLKPQAWRSMEALVDTRTIQAYLGHKSIQHTVRYTELAPTRFKSLFRD